MSVARINVSGVLPFRMTNFLKPRIDCGFHGALVLVSRESFDKPGQRVPGDDAHKKTLSCSQNGHNKVQYAIALCAEMLNRDFGALIARLR